MKKNKEYIRYKKYILISKLLMINSIIIAVLLIGFAVGYKTNSYILKSAICVFIENSCIVDDSQSIKDPRNKPNI